MSSLGDRLAHRLWIGSAGTAAGFALARTVRNRWPRASLVAADTNPPHLVATSLFAQAYERVPPVSDDQFVPHLLAGLERHRIDTYVPILDEEIVVAAELYEGGRLPQAVKALVPSVAAARRCLDKLATAAWLLERQVPAARTELASQAEWRPPGVFVKPRFGRGSIGARAALSASDFERACHSSEPLIVQELCRAPEITVDAFRSHSGGFFRALCRERLEVKAGVCTKARVFEDEQLASCAARVASSLELTRVACIQFMRPWDSEGWLVTDVNPRLGAGTAMCSAVGVDFHAALVADAWKDDVRPFLPALAKERYVVRQYAEYAL